MTEKLTVTELRERFQTLEVFNSEAIRTQDGLYFVKPTILYRYIPRHDMWKTLHLDAMIRFTFEASDVNEEVKTLTVASLLTHLNQPVFKVAEELSKIIAGQDLLNIATKKAK